MNQNQPTIIESQPIGAAKSGLDRDGKKRIVTVLIYFVVIYGIMFAAAGTFRWSLAWVYVTLSLLGTAVGGIWAARKNPEIINERGRKSDKTKPWDKVFGAIYAPTLILIPATAGLDFRWAWSSVPMIISIIALVGMVPALYFPYWAMGENKFLATTVRLQEERGHYVVSTGPYAIVRHPMYTGAILSHLLTPLVLDSWWALVPGIIAVIAITVRTSLEDNTLQKELPGYLAYTQKTRYRLVPGIW